MKVKLMKVKGKRNFYQAWEYVKESKKFIYIAIGVFFAFSILGFIFKNQLSFLDPLLRDLINRTQDLKGFDLISFIFWNNLQSAFFGMILGVFFGLFSFANAIINGTVLGYVFGKIYDVSGINDFWRILPHGIFELPAIFIALGLGIRLGGCLFSDNPKKVFVERIRKSLYSFVFFVIPLLIIAAVIEGILITLAL